MGEQPIVEIARRLAAGETVRDLRDMRGVAYALGARETPPADAIVLPSFEEVKTDKHAVRPGDAGSSTRRRTRSTPSGSSSTTTARPSSCNPPGLPISQEDMDRIYGLPYTRRPHPMYRGEKIPAFETVKDSVTIMRGCFGGCTFCSITAHQGRIIQSRSQESVLTELRRMGPGPEFSGVVSDIGGPTANMYQMRCTRPEVEAKCKRLSCVHPEDLQAAGDRPRPARRADAREPRGRRASTRCSSPRASGWTWPSSRPSTWTSWPRHHVGGHLKVAPEHTDPDVLKRMKKPEIDDYEGFADAFQRGERRGRASRSNTSSPTSSRRTPAATWTR